jgi:photosystem II stability/assembly factor-like uncharacterized protein
MTNGSAITTTTAEPIVHDTSTDPYEMLIKEARRLQRRQRRRRWAVALTLVVAVAAVLVVTAGGGRIPSRGRAIKASRSPASSATNGDNASTLIPSGQFVESVWPVGGQTSWVFTLNVAALAGGGQGIEWTNDGGKTWRDATPAGYSRFAGNRFIGSMFALSGTRAWLLVGPGAPTPSTKVTLLTTDDAGRSWSRVGTIPLAGCSLDFVTPLDGVCTSAPGAMNTAPLELATTSDGGRTWTTTFNNTADYTGVSTRDGGLPYECDKKFVVTPPSTVWAEGWCNATNAFLYRSTDGGRHWALASAAQPSPLVGGGAEFTGPVVLSGREGAVAFEEGNFSLVYVTRNGGDSFTPVYPPGPERPWTVDIVSPNVWRLTFRNQILGTNDGGASWFGATSNAFASPVIRYSQRWSTGAPNSLNFTSTSFGWMTWSTGNGNDVMVTRNGGRTWRRVAVPGTSTQRN